MSTWPGTDVIRHRSRQNWTPASVLLTFLTALVLVTGAAFFSSPSPASAGSQNGCSVTPAPVLLDQPWTIQAWGLTPNASYWTNVTQAADPSNGAHPQNILTTDTSGAGQVDYATTDPMPDLILAEGSAKVRVYPAKGWPGDAKGTVNCTFTVQSGAPSPSPSSSPTPTPSATQSPSPSPTASATPSPTVSPTATTAPPTTPPATTPPPSPSPSPTVSPTPTITGPTGRTCPAFPAMPDAACTGVPPGVTLHACSSTISAAGTYDSCLFTGGVYINARNVTITRSRVLGIVGGSTYNDPTRNLKLIDVEIDGGTTIDPDGQAAVGGNGYTCLRCHVHRTGRGANAGSNVEIRDSLFYDFGSVSSAHITAIGSNGGGHSQIVHNSLTCNVMAGRAGGCSAAFSLYGDFDPIDDWLVQNNSFASVHGFCTYGGSVSGKAYPHATNVRFLDNVFGPCPQYGAYSGWENNAGNVWSGNRWQDGTVITV